MPCAVAYGAVIKAAARHFFLFPTTLPLRIIIRTITNNTLPGDLRGITTTKKLPRQLAIISCWGATISLARTNEESRYGEREETFGLESLQCDLELSLLYFCTCFVSFSVQLGSLEPDTLGVNHLDGGGHRRQHCLICRTERTHKKTPNACRTR